MNTITPINGIFNGMSTNPLPLEFFQSVSTAKNLSALLAKIDQVITFTNSWYETILTDIEGRGMLYTKLTDQFGNDIKNINTSITSINTLITALEYTKPYVSLNSSPAVYLYSIGETINSVMLNYTVSKGTNNLTKAEIYKNNVLIDTITNVQNGINNYVDATPITSNTEYYIKVYDDILSVSSTKIDYNFVYKAWYGKMANNATVTESLIQTLNNIDFQNNFDFTIATLNDDKIIIVSHDDLKSVVDSENYDMIDSFTVTNINMNINNNVIPYKVYVSTNPILDTNITLNVGK